MDNLFHKDSTLNDKIEALEFLNGLLEKNLASDPRNLEKKIRVEMMITEFKAEEEARKAKRRERGKLYRRKKLNYCPSGW